MFFYATICWVPRVQDIREGSTTNWCKDHSYKKCTSAQECITTQIISRSYQLLWLDSLSHVFAPLYRLLQKTKPWSWEPPQQKCFEQATYMLTSGSVLVHFDPEKELVLACDASPWHRNCFISLRVRWAGHWQRRTCYCDWGEVIPSVSVWWSFLLNTCSVRMYLSPLEVPDQVSLWK